MIINKLDKHFEHFKKYNIFYYDILSSLNIQESKRIGTLGVYCHPNTAQLHLDINYDFFNSHTFDEQIALLIHEINHLVNFHLIRNKGKDNRIFNIATDMSINQLIPNLPKDALYPNKTWKKNMYAEYYYKYLSLDNKGIKNKLFGVFGKNDNCKGLKPIDNHDNWSKCDVEKTTNAISDAIKKSIEKGNCSESQINEIENNLKKLSSISNIDNDFPPFSRGQENSISEALNQIRSTYNIFNKEINWQEQLKKFIYKCVKKQYRNTIKRPNRRYNIPYGRNNLKHHTPKGIIVVDISPSIPNELMIKFKKEIQNIIHLVKECRVFLVDDTIKNDFIIKTKQHKFFNEQQHFGSGTDLKVVFKHLKKDYKKADYNFLIYFTDLEADIPQIDLAPTFPVLWAVYNPDMNVTKSNVKFGDVLCLNQ